MEYGSDELWLAINSEPSSGSEFQMLKAEIRDYAENERCEVQRIRSEAVANIKRLTDDRTERLCGSEARAVYDERDFKISVVTRDYIEANQEIDAWEWSTIEAARRYIQSKIAGLSPKPDGPSSVEPSYRVRSPRLSIALLDDGDDTEPEHPQTIPFPGSYNPPGYDGPQAA